MAFYKLLWILRSKAIVISSLWAAAVLAQRSRENSPKCKLIDSTIFSWKTVISKTALASNRTYNSTNSYNNKTLKLYNSKKGVKKNGRRPIQAKVGKSKSRANSAWRNRTTRIITTKAERNKPTPMTTRARMTTSMECVVQCELSQVPFNRARRKPTKSSAPSRKCSFHLRRVPSWSCWLSSVRRPSFPFFPWRSCSRWPWHRCSMSCASAITTQLGPWASAQNTCTCSSRKA